MNYPQSQKSNCTCLNQRLLLCLALGATVSGCWSEVEYTEPAVAEKSTAAVELSTGVDPAKAASGFGDDLAATLAAEMPATVDPADTTPIEETNPTSAAVVGDRYAAKGPAVETAAAEPEEPATTPPAEDFSGGLFDDPPTEEVAATEPPATTTATAEPAATELPTSTTPAVTDTVASLFDEPDAAAPPVPGENTVDGSKLPEEREAIAETSDELIANLNDDDIPAPTDQAARNTRRAAWLLGSKLSLAALANDYSASNDEVQKLYGQSQTLAEMLGITVPELPARPAADAPTSTTKPAFNFLLGAAGQEIGRELARRQSADQAALFELAVKSNLLLVLYQPGSSTTGAIAAAIERAGPRANLPATLWQPLLETLTAQASLADVRTAVYKLHADADKYLEQPVE
jgi:hypothetical protein